MRRWSFSHPLKMVKRDSHGKGWSAKLYDKAASAPRVSLPKYNQILSQVFWNRIGVLCPITCQYQWGLKRDPWFFFGCVVCQLSEREKKKLVPFDVEDYIFICPGGPMKQYLALTLVTDLDSHISALLYII